MQFIGHFHPLVVHFPIALILLLPVLELAARRPQWEFLRPAAGFVLTLAMLAAFVAPGAGLVSGAQRRFLGPAPSLSTCGAELPLRLRLSQCWLLRGRGVLYIVLLAEPGRTFWSQWDRRHCGEGSPLMETMT